MGSWADVRALAHRCDDTPDRARGWARLTYQDVLRAVHATMESDRIAAGIDGNRAPELASGNRRQPGRAGRQLSVVAVVVWLGCTLASCGPTTCDVRVEPGTQQVGSDQPGTARVC